jgi:transcription elongation factor GreA
VPKNFGLWKNSLLPSYFHPEGAFCVETTILTAAGVQELEKQLEFLKTVARKAVAEQIKIARDFGDLSENAEYDEAKNEQSRVEGEIARIEQRLRNAVVIDEDAISTNVVSLGSVVTVEESGNGGPITYTIVGSTEANPMEGRISNESPVGKALLGYTKGDQLEVHTPVGIIKYQIIDIQRG